MLNEIDDETSVALLSGEDFWTTKPNEALELRSMRFSDGPHGLRINRGGGGLDPSHTVPATCFPTAVTLGSTWDSDLLRQVGDALGEACVRMGVDVLLGPGLNIKRHPHGGRNFEYFSEDPFLSGVLAASMVKGIQTHPVAACPKHFAANNHEANRHVVDVIVDRRTLFEMYLRGFEIVVTESAPRALMCAYNSLNGPQCSEHQELLTGILRQRWGFDGLVMSDWGATRDRAAGIEAGLDLQMPGCAGLFDSEVLEALASGRLERDAIDRSIDRLKTLADRTVEARTARDTSPMETAAQMDSRHHELAVTAAAAGTVLLTNDGVLPLAPGSRIAVIGGFATYPRIQGAGSSQVNARRGDTPLEEIAARFGMGNVTAASGFDARTGATSAEQLAEAIECAKAAEISVVFAGLPASWESEGYDRHTSALPEGVNRVIEAVAVLGKPVVVVLQNGSPVETPWASKVNAIIESYLGGQGGATAVAQVLAGDREPGGRLAETFASPEAHPSDANFPGAARQVQYRESLYVGYRYFSTAGVAAQFPFGHGLSYTTFSWANPQFADGVATCEVTNTGDCSGSDVVQVYAQRPPGFDGPILALVGFAKVWLDPGETRTVEIPLDHRGFAYFDTGADDWAPILGEHRVHLAKSAGEMVVEVARFEVGGTPPVTPGGPDIPWRPTDAEFAVLLARPIPVPRPLHPFDRDSTLADLTSGPVARRIFNAAKPLIAKGIAKETGIGDPAMIGKFVEYIAESPLRMLCANSKGAFPLEIADAIAAALDSGSPREKAAAARRLVAVLTEQRKRR